MFVNLGSQSLGYSLYQIIITISNFVSGTEFQCMIYIPKNKIFNLLQFWRLKLTRNTMPDTRQKYTHMFICRNRFQFVHKFFGTKPGHHAVTSFTKPGPAILSLPISFAPCLLISIIKSTQ